MSSNVNSVGLGRVTTRASQGQSAARGEGKKPAASPAGAAAPTHTQIAERACMIWKSGGCLSGHDEANWLEAEGQLKREFEIRA